MCGIVAVHRLDGGRPDAVLGSRMLDRIAHRGPDGRGEQAFGSTWLGHARLSIVDLPGGAQPLGDDDTGMWVVGNGEIYNHTDLRGELDWAFTTDSDNEAMVAAVHAEGPSGVGRLVGMFAFVAAGPEGPVAARDPVGIKPLYWVRDGARLLFASEIKAFDAEDRPLVEEFPAGHWWTPDDGLARYADPVAPAAAPFTDRDEARTAIREALVTGVRRRMMADVEIGVFLSGGLDSSLVAAIMASEALPGQRIHSFAAGTAASSDLAAAREVAAYLGLDHHERVYDARTVADALPRVVGQLESAEPSLVRSAVPNLLVAELAAAHVKVVLTGEGSDELFAGYDHYRELTDPEVLAKELDRDLTGLHNLNLQRCDRVTMAHSLEARVPFLDLDVIATARRVPIGWRLPGEPGREKAILRQAFAGWLPDRLLWRVKEQFGDGSGTATVMDDYADQLVPEDDWSASGLPGFPAPRSREELGYQRLLHDALGGLRVEQVLGRWATA
ncbi:MAG TPA: asparagine synthase (glutamine-hydrolyzing) [Nocardioidaceae bacterium]|nr:asparagine synthase (glutamine-hydrolyzing) [Nocardioidaceae bacterium]